METHRYYIRLMPGLSRRGLNEKPVSEDLPLKAVGEDVDISPYPNGCVTNVTARTEIGDDAKLAFKALHMAFPKKVLAHDNENLIAISN